ncbi:MAG: NAD(P)/FAD-dependent oxidoreductase [Kiritimatiellia bacterium]|jgi:protoporphyrinogen oxidase
MPSPDVVIVGAGMSGLTCALALHQAGRKVLIVEAADEVGGRVRSHRAGDFVLDRGFQVLLTAYPTCREFLDFEKLRLGAFHPGAIVQTADGAHVIGDPFRRRVDLLATLRAPIGSTRDKMLVAKLRFQSALSKPEVPWFSENIPTIDWLRAYGFSPRMIETFFRPFLAGIFLEKELATSARMFKFVYRCFTLGNAALPAGGMGEIPRQIATRIGDARIWLNSRVASIESGKVRIDGGREVEAPKIVIATDGDQARRWIPSLPARNWHGGVCYYFDAPKSPFMGRRRKLWLNATGRGGRVNHIAVPSDVARGYAPLGRALVSVNTVGDAQSPAHEDDIRKELRTLLGEQVDHWRFLRSYPVPRSLPRLNPEDVDALAGNKPELPPNVFLCGDILTAGSLETAMASGAAAAKVLLASS